MISAREILSVEQLLKIPAHQGSVYALARGGTDIFFSGSGDGTVIRWDIHNPEKAQPVAKVPANIYSIFYIPESEILLIGQIHGGLHVVGLKEKKEIRHLALHKNGIFDIIERGGMLFLGGGDGVLSIWSKEDFSLHRSIQISNKSIRSISYHPHKNELALGTSDFHIYIVDMEMLQVKQILKQHQNSIFKVSYSPDGLFLYSGSRDAHLGIWETEKYTLKDYIPAHNYTINDIAFHSSGKYFATASRDKSIKLWRAEDGAFIKKLGAESGGHINSVNKVLWFGNTLISCSDDRSLIIWNTREN